MDFTFSPIGYVHCQQKYTYDVPRQGILSSHQAFIELKNGFNFEQALQDLQTFERIWLIYLFHQNHHWKPLIHPPRGNTKVGVFASRAPYRPNPIGLSCVELEKIRGRKIFISQHDLLDGTPILDIKPYLPYADSFPDSCAGWTENVKHPLFEIVWSEKAQEQNNWLLLHQGPEITNFIIRELTYAPFSQKRKRLVVLSLNQAILAYRTWRIKFTQNSPSTILIEKLFSGYSQEDLQYDQPDPYLDKELHRLFNLQFSPSLS